MSELSADCSAPESDLALARRELIASAQIWYCARRDLQARHDLKGDLQMIMRSAEQDLEDAVLYLAMAEQAATP